MRLPCGYTNVATEHNECIKLARQSERKMESASERKDRERREKEIEMKGRKIEGREREGKTRKM